LCDFFDDDRAVDHARHRPADRWHERRGRLADGGRGISRDGACLSQRRFRARAIATLFVGYLAFWAVRYTYESWQFKDMPTGQIALPMWIPQLSFALGAILLLAVIVDEFLIVLRGGTPNFVRVVEERHARGDYSEDL
jgi:hypothetical protein